MNNGIYTAIDASINRAIEGLRVCEDIFRFAFHHPVSSGLKALRHSIRDAASVFPESRLLDARDTDSDSQKFIDTEGECRRSGLAGVFRANIRRAAEAVRSLEELSKIDDPAAGAVFQSIRFRIYEVEKKCWFIIRREDMLRRINGKYCVIIDHGIVGIDDFPAAVSEAAAAGAGSIVLRLKNESDSENLTAAWKLSSLCIDCGLPCFVYSRPDIATLAGARGVCLEPHDLSPDDAGKIAGEEMLIGIYSEIYSGTPSALPGRADFIFSAADEKTLTITSIIYTESPGGAMTL